MDGKTRSTLRKMAHGLNPVVMVGKNGLTDGVWQAVDEALENHELIKIKFIDFKDSKQEIAGQLTKTLSAELIGIIGNIVILYRQNPDEEKRIVIFEKTR
ncbi:MAG: ribosome assembly RNA-binding protein YhbY [Spirochaetia bacterium]|nr:ribosome assembly RNA-binding protein YhbY [Spirochaetia bacterium]